MAQRQKPDPGSPNYQQQVAASIQDLTSGRRPRDPKMNSASTGRLILEGVLENVKIYRLHKQEKAREAKEMEEKGEKRRHKRRSDNGHSQRSRRHRSLDRDGERHSRHRRRRSAGDADGHRHERRHHHRSREGDRDRERNRGKGGGLGASDSHEYNHNRSAEPLHAAEHVVKQLRGPDGTPFGQLPTRNKGVSLLAHAANIYRHTKAEQDGGHRNKGFAEKHIDALLQKRKDAKSATNGGDGEKEPLIEKDRVERRSGDREHRSRRRCRSRSRQRERRLARDDLPIFEGPSGARQDTPASPGRQPTPLTQEPALPVSPSRRGSHRSQSRSRSRAPTIRIQSPTPPDARSVQPPIAFSHGPLPRTQSSEPGPKGPVIPSRDPSPTPMPPPELVNMTPYPATLSAIDMPVPATPVAPSMPPPPPPSSSRQPSLPTANPAHDALLASKQVGTKLEKVRDEDKEDKNPDRKKDARITKVSSGQPVYQETSHSHDVEAREHAQAVEERERTEEEERVTLTKTPLAAPQPRPKLPTNFQDELTAKLRGRRVSAQEDSNDAHTETGAKETNLRPRASNETWRTVFSDPEEMNRIPDRAFRDSLGHTLSRPQTAAGASSSRVDASGPDVSTNLAADVDSSGWQSGPSWDFSNVPKDNAD